MFCNALEGLLSDEEAQRSAASSSHTPPERKQALESRQLGLVLRAAGVEISILDRVSGCEWMFLLFFLLLSYRVLSTCIRQIGIWARRCTRTHIGH